jgi:hypothetical protein
LLLVFPQPFFPSKRRHQKEQNPNYLLVSLLFQFYKGNNIIALGSLSTDHSIRQQTGKDQRHEKALNTLFSLGGDFDIWHLIPIHILGHVLRQ